jgi:hypothetical protein
VKTKEELIAEKNLAIKERVDRILLLLKRFGKIVNSLKTLYLDSDRSVKAALILHNIGWEILELKRECEIIASQPIYKFPSGGGDYE